MKAAGEMFRARLPGVRISLCLVMAFAFWLNANPYAGIVQDARLYSVMAYHWLDPQPFLRDPWFLFGSQDEYSLFSPLLAAAYTVLGVGQGARFMTVVQGLFFSIAITVFARQGLGKKRYALAALLMVAFPVLYSPRGILYVTEGFVTARGFAVALSVLGLAMSCRRRGGWAALCHLMALSLHPIMALVPATISVLHPFVWRIRIVLMTLASIGYVVLLLAALHGYLPLIEGDWRYYLELAPLIFTSGWMEGELPQLTLWAGLLVLAARNGAPRLRSIYALAALVPAIAMAYSWLATWVPWTLALEVQFWRGLWLLKLMGLCAVADLLGILVFRRIKPGVRPARVMAIWILATGFSHPLWAVAPLTTLARPSWVVKVDRWLEHHPRMYRGIVVFLAVLSLPEMLFALTDRVGDPEISGYWREVLYGFQRTAAFGLVAIGAAWGGGRLRPRALALVATVLLCTTALTWDSRSREQRTEEDRYTLDGSRSCLGERIPRGSTVYWPEQILRTWLELGTASYVGGLHATGLVFSRDRLVLVERRLSNIVVSMSSKPEFPAIIDANAVRAKALGILATRPLVNWSAPFSYESAGRPSPAGIAWLCQDPQLDFVLNPPPRATEDCAALSSVMVACAPYRAKSGSADAKGR